MNTSLSKKPLLSNNPLLKYIIKRILLLIPVIFGVSFLIFFIFYLSPNDPATNILGDFATPEDIAIFRERYNLNDPMLTRFFDFIKGLVQFDLGNSYRGDIPVVDEIMLRFPATLSLTICSMFVALIIAIPAGIISATKQYSIFDNVSMVLALLGISIPNFWLGIMLISLFSVKLGWLPSLYLHGNILSYILPSIVIGTALAAATARMTRSSMLEIIRQDYITTARAKGLPEGRIIRKHALRNALIPVITIIGLQFSACLGGAAVTEKVFSWPGLGSRIIEAQMDNDIPMILGGVVYISVVISIVNLIIDILYAVIDPKILARYRGKK